MTALSVHNWDVIIVGAGSSGSVLAARLSEDENRRVLLIEAGSAPKNSESFDPEILSALMVSGARADLPTNWRVPGFITPDREFDATRGRVLGGSSATNGGYFIRPRLADFSHWEHSGSSLWGYEHTLPLMRAMETDLTYGASAIHGDDGPVPVSRTSTDSLAAHMFISAAHELGIGDHIDMNDQGDDGVGPVPTNTRDGVQYNSAMTYLTPARERQNLTVWADTTVERILFAGITTAGVRVRRAGSVTDIACDEVILCAGALATPQLLMLSGIGPEDLLTRHSIPVTVVSAGVGQGLSDHPQLFGMWMPRETELPPSGSWMGGVLHTVSDESLVEIILSEQSLDELVGQPATGAKSLLVAPLTPRRTGEVTITSASMDDAPVVHYRYLDSAEVRADLRASARLIRDVLDTEAVQKQAAWSWGPEAEVLATDNALDAWIAEQIGTSMHACATASFAGPNPVVDPEGRVIGVTGLRIADTSILPAAPHRGPAVAALLVGEIIAATIKAEGK